MRDLTASEALFNCCQRGYLFVTPNKRLVYSLKQTLAKSLMTGLDREVCAIPRVIAYEDLVEDIVLQQSFKGRLAYREFLHPSAEAFVWEDIIRNDFREQGAETPLLSYPALAREAQRAFRLALEWQLDPEGNQFQFNAQFEGERLLVWFKQFQERCERLNRVTRAQMQQAIIAEQWTTSLANPDAIKTARLESMVPEPGICLFGFHALRPLQETCLQSLLGASLTADNCVRLADECHWAHSTESPSQSNFHAPMQFAADNAEHEFRCAARWLVHRQAKNPAGRFAVVVPDLAASRPSVERIFKRVFADFSQDAATAGYDALNLSSGIPLVSTAIARHWLLLVKSMGGELSIRDSNELLASPYWIGRSLKLQREFSKAFAAIRTSELSLSAWLRALDWFDPTLLEERNAIDSQFLKALRAITEVLRREFNPGATRTMQEWLSVLHDWTERLHWPMGRGHSSDEYQQYHMFQRCLQQITEHSHALGELNFKSAIGLIERFFRDTDYQRQTLHPPDRSIPDVLGVLETNGQRFDGIWLCQMGDREWPISGQLNALIPYALQYELSMPGTPSREFAYNHQLTEHLLQRGDEIVVSYCKTLDDAEQQLTPYIAEKIDCQQFAFADLPESILELSNRAAGPIDEYALDVLQDPVGRPLSGDDARLNAVEDGADNARWRISGGMQMLRGYAVLPLEAYFRYRLGIEVLTVPTTTFSPQERGIAIHAALDIVWRELRHSDSLAAASREEREKLLEAAVLDQLTSVNRLRFKPLCLVELELEAAAVKQLILAWLDLEKAREPFSVIAGELNVSYVYGQHRIAGRIDRVDLVADGGLQLIDYKTGVAQARSWFDEDGFDPQLPLYALALQDSENNQRGLGAQCASRFGDGSPIEDETVQCLSFANLSVGNIGYSGCSANDLDALHGPGVRPLNYFAGEDQTWRVQLANWKESIDALFQMLLDGDANMLATAEVQSSPYQPLLRSGYVYNNIIDTSAARVRFYSTGQKA